MINVPSAVTAGGEQLFKELADMSGRQISEIRQMYWSEYEAAKNERMMNPRKYAMTDDASDLAIEAGQSLRKKIEHPEEEPADRDLEYADMMTPNDDAQAPGADMFSETPEDEVNAPVENPIFSPEETELVNRASDDAFKDETQETADENAADAVNSDVPPPAPGQEEEPGAVQEQPPEQPKQ